jgi:hypothetical protein
MTHPCLLKRVSLLTLLPPLRPLSHNANPRDGAQDILHVQVLFVFGTPALVYIR